MVNLSLSYCVLVDVVVVVVVFCTFERVITINGFSSLMSNTCDHIIPYGIEIEIASVKMLRYIRKDVYYEIYALFIDVCESYE